MPSMAHTMQLDISEKITNDKRKKLFAFNKFTISTTSKTNKEINLVNLEKDIFCQNTGFLNLVIS